MKSMLGEWSKVTSIVPEKQYILKSDLAISFIALQADAAAEWLTSRTCALWERFLQI